VNDRPAAAIEHRAQVVERLAQVQVRHVDTPVVMRPQRSREARALLRPLSEMIRGRAAGYSSLCTGGASVCS
jgi:hypothetical protein